MASQIDPSRLLQLTKNEQRKQNRIVELIGGMLKSDLPASIKAFAAILLFLFGTGSMVMLVLIIDVVSHSLSKASDPFAHATFFATLLSAHGVMAVLIGFPLTMKMSSIEESRRLEADLLKVQSVKRLRRKAGGERSAQAH